MTKRLRRLSSIGLPLALIAALGASVTLAQRSGPGHGPPDPARMMERLTSELDLSELQKQELQDRFATHREQMQPQRERMQAARQRLEDQVRAESLDEPAIRAAAAQVAELTAEQAVSRARFQQELREILTPQQMARLAELKQERQERRAERRERRSGGGFGGPHRGPSAGF